MSKKSAARASIACCVLNPPNSFKHEDGFCANKSRKTKPRVIVESRIVTFPVSIFSPGWIAWLRQSILSAALGGVNPAVAELAIWSRLSKSLFFASSCPAQNTMSFSSFITSFAFNLYSLFKDSKQAESLANSVSLSLLNIFFCLRAGVNLILRG